MSQDTNNEPKYYVVSVGRKCGIMMIGKPQRDRSMGIVAIAIKDIGPREEQ